MIAHNEKQAISDRYQHRKNKRSVIAIIIAILTTGNHYTFTDAN